jgi:hypothetical protein
VVLNSNVLARKVPTPCDGLDNLQIAQQPVGDIESSQLRAEDLSRWVSDDRRPER